jgi:3-dehydroquinate synthase
MNGLQLNAHRPFQSEVVFGTHHLNTLTQKDSIFFIYDETLSEAIIQPLLALDETKALGIPAGEPAKTWTVVQRVIDHFETINISKSTVLCAIGGGALTDVAAFVGSIYLRGLETILIPTTLLAMVDASIGGKTAINGRYKNRIGSFYPVAKILIDETILEKMPPHLVQEGMSEVIKIAAIQDEDFFIQLEDQTLPLTDIVRKAIQLKIDIVEKDLTDQGERLLLNFGHTTAHALEAYHDYAYSHGACVAAGMVLETAHQPFGKRLMNVLMTYECFTPIPFEKESLTPFFMGDKKRTHDTLHWIKMIRIGEAKIQQIPLAECLETIPQHYPTLEESYARSE